jgi:hemolysin III
LALIGVLQEWKQKSASRIVSLVIYIVMGWVAIAAVAPLIRGLGHAGFAWLAAGGVFYTVGIVFYVLDKRLKHAHGIWHLFVLAGSATHYNTILRYVV